MSETNKNIMTYYEVDVSQFSETAKLMKKMSASLTAQWAVEGKQFFEVYACYRTEEDFLIVKSLLPKDKPEFPSVSKIFLAASRFERQIYSFMGIKALGNSDLRPWIKFADWPADAWPLRKDFNSAQCLKRVKGEYAWIQAEGEGVNEIPVGPVHAGIIEPGHFRFQAVGETIINLEERLGYTHKGIEKRFESLGWLEGYKLAGRVSGDSTVAHSLTYCRALESMTDFTLPPRAAWLRAIFLERERIANHLGDIGAICSDAAFSIMLYQFMRLKEHFLRTNQTLFAHRFMMDCVVPGGVSVNISAEGAAQMTQELAALETEFERLVKIYDGNPSLEERVRDTGILSTKKALEIGVVGVVARASGLNLDSRSLYPFAPYDKLQVKVPLYTAGDVNSRVWVRIEEVRESMRLLRELLADLPDTTIKVPCPLPERNSTGFAVVEGWRGEVMYWLQATSAGTINRCMVRDPSAVNWLGLESAVIDNIVPDFPLCNKSFNASYAGHDL